MRFAQKLTVLMLMILLFTILTVSYFGYRASINILEKQIIDRLQDETFHAMDKIDRMLFERHADIHMMAHDPVLSSRSSTPKQITERLMQYRDNYKTYVSLSFFDLNRVRIADTNGLHIGEEHPVIGYWKDIARDKVSVASDVRMTEDLKMPIIFTASHVKDREGKAFGVVVGRILASRLDSILAQIGELDWVKRGDVKVDLVNKDNTLLYSNYNKKGILKKKAADIEVDDTTEETSTKKYRHKGLRSIYAFCREQGYLDFKGNGWTLRVHIPMRIAFGPVFELRNQILVLLLPLIVFSAVIVLLFSRTLSRPIAALKTAVDEFGRDNLDAKVEVKSTDEIGELAASFDKMKKDLKASREKLKSWAATLEERVKNRTNELAQAQEATLNILEDLTEEKKTIEKYSKELERLLRVKSDFTSMVSHELRTPLTAIKEGIAIVMDGTAGPLKEEQKEFLEIAKRNVDRLARLINDILSFQKLEAGRVEFKIEENDINEVVKEVGETMYALAKEKDLELEADIDEGLPRIKFDRDKTTQVLTNIVDNAIKVTGKGSVLISTSQGDNFVRVSVRDTGPGIKREDMPKLFHSFTQLESGIDRKTGGTGLGLAISKEIIEKQGGRIWAESEPGKGSTFQFILPIEDRRVTRRV